MAYIQKTTQIT